MQALKRHRLAKGMTLEQVASKLGVGKAAVQNWECGRNLPRPHLVPRLARVLGINELDLTHVLCPEPQPRVIFAQPINPSSMHDGMVTSGAVVGAQ